MTVDNPELEQLKAADPVDQPLAVLKLSADIASHVLIEAWDSKEAIQSYNQYLANPEYENVLKASKAYFTDKLQDRAVNTKIGIVRISSKSKGKIHDRMRDVKYLAIPFIPEILLTGEVGDFVPLHKDRTDSAEGFFEFVKIVDLESFKVLIRLKVSQDSHGNLLYFLAAQKNKNPNDHITSSKLHGANPGSEEHGFDSITLADSTSQTGEEINIEFVEVHDAAGKVVTLEQLLEVLGIKGFDSLNNSIDRFANQAATSTENDLAEPTPGQLITGQYQKGELRLAGLAIEIENPAGSVRKGVAADGKAWESQMTAHYGYLANTIGVDGDELDVFVKAGTSPDWNGTVYVVNQVDPLTAKFDEHKLVLGADSQQEAEAIYLSNYEEGWQGLGSIKAISIQILKERINNGGTETMFDSAYVEALYAVTDEDIKSSPETAVSLLNTCCQIWEGLSNSNGNSQGILKGRNVSVKTAKGTKISTVLAVVEAASLITSHDGMGAKNPAFPQELQPRDRGREASQAWVQKVAANLDPDSLGRTTRADTGAPIIGPDMVVESGNGRTMAINLAYARGQAEDYRNWLIEEADYLGFKAELVANFTQPVLVRLRESDIDRVAFTVEANQDDKLSLSATERAKSDAKRIDNNLIQLFMPGEDGDLLAGSNQKFIQGFLKSLGDTESAQYVTTDGKPTQSLVARIKAAVFQKAYGDERLLEMVADQTRPEIQNVLNALNVAAPKFIESQAFDRAKTEDLSSSIVDSIELSMDQKVVSAIIEATNVVLAAKADSQDVAEYVKQQGLFGDLPSGVAEIAVFISQNGRSSKKLALFFKAMATYIEQYMVEQQNHGLFGDSEPLKINAVIGHAIQKMKNEYGDNVNLSMFDAIDSEMTALSAEQFHANLKARLQQMAATNIDEPMAMPGANYAILTSATDPLVILEYAYHVLLHREDPFSDDPNAINYRYKDTGYIAGAKKELALAMIRDACKSGQRLRVTDIDFAALEENPRLAAKTIIKSNLFGKTDWQALQEAGMDPAAGFLIEKIYASIGTEPTNALPAPVVKSIASDYVQVKQISDIDRTSDDALAQTRKDYARGLETIRDFLEKAKTVEDVLQVLKDIREELNGTQLDAEQSQAVVLLYIEYKKKDEAAKAAKKAESDLYQKFYDLRHQLNIVSNDRDSRVKRKWKPDPELESKYTELAGQVDLAEQAYKNYREEHPELKTQERDVDGGIAYKNELEWEAYQFKKQIREYERQGKVNNILNNPATRAWLSLGERFLAVVNYRGYYGSKTFAGHVTNAKTGKVKDWQWADKEKPKEPKPATKQEISFQLRIADSFERIGGKPVNVDSTLALEQLVGLRAVQSGNWVLKDPNSAKFHVEQTAAAMSDMADVLGIDVNLLGFGGRLGLAFGARGRGGKGAAAAHYEPVQRVMNITKMRGGGALGHEWFHAFDDVLTEMVTGKTGQVGQFASLNSTLLPTASLQIAMQNLLSAMLAGQVRLSQRFVYTGADVAEAKYNISPEGRRWVSNQGLFIRTFDNATDAVLAYDEKYGGQITKRNFKDHLRWRKMAVAYFHKGELGPKDTAMAVLKTGELRSNFASEASILDRNVFGKYWSSIPEMSARAFQSYLEDKLASQNRKNDYLSVFADNKFHVDPLFGEMKPYPEGEERTRINAAFDALFEVIRTEKVFENAVNDQALMDSIFGNQQAAFDSWLADGHYEQISIGELKQHPLVNRLKEKQPAKNAPILVQQTHSGNLLLIVGVKVLEQLEIQGDEFVPAIILDVREGFNDKVLQKVLSKYTGSLDAKIFAADAEQLVEQLSVNSLHGFDSVSMIEIEELKQEQDPVAVLRACLAIISQMDIGVEKLPIEKLLAKHDQFIRLAQEGKITVEEWKQNYYTFLDNIEVLQDYLNSQKVKELLDLGGAYFTSRYRGEKKDRIVKALVQNYLQEYSLNSVVSYTWGQTFEDAIKEIIENGTQQNIDDYAKEYADLLQEHQDKIAGMEDPQTLDDFQRLLSVQRQEGLTFNQFYLGLTPEQRARMDILSAELSAGKKEAERKAQSVNYSGEVAGATIHATQHTRDGHDIWTVVLDKRLEREDYQAAVGNAKRLNGYYSSYRGGGAIPGFVFRSEEEAKAFVALVAGDAQGAQALVDQQQSVYEDNKAQSTIERLRSMADSLEQRSSEELDSKRKVNTARRLRMARAIEDRSRANIADAETMRNLSSAIENKSVKFLGNLRARTQLDFMNSMLRRAKWKEKQANPDKCTELEGSGVKYPPLTTDTASYVEFPNFGLYRSEWAIIGRQLVENKGTKQIGANLLKIADDMTKEYLSWLKTNYMQVTTTKGDGSAAIYEASKAEIEYAIQRAGKKGKVVPYQVKRGIYAIILAPELAKERGLWMGDDDKLIQVNADFGNQIIDAIKKAGINMPWQLQVAQDQQNALTRLGITSPAMLRAALREFISLKVAPQEPDEIKELERDMIGREKDGLDFFPTPDSAAMDMIQMAQLGPDMKVLEPSAGMGHIAEKIRAAGVEPDVIEYSGPRRELLEKKGFTVIGEDFMRVTQDTMVDDEPIGLYDRIIMNPPFSNRQDAEHVQHAYDLLKPGGRIVAIMGEGVFYGQDGKAKAFRNWLDSVNGESEKLPDKTFMDASLPVTTGANARIVVIRK